MLFLTEQLFLGELDQDYESSFGSSAFLYSENDAEHTKQLILSELDQHSSMILHTVLQPWFIENDAVHIEQLLLGEPDEQHDRLLAATEGAVAAPPLQLQRGQHLLCGGAHLSPTLRQAADTNKGLAWPKTSR